MIKIKLPDDLRIFKAKVKECSPWEKFYKWLIPQLPHNTKIGMLLTNDTIWGIPDGYNIDVTKIGIHSKDYAFISDLTYRWGKKKLSFYTDKIIRSNIAMLELDIGPKEYRKEEVEAGYVYINDNYLRKL